MIKKLRVKNFKCFREEKEFDFGRITLLLGANSSGKSSVMYAILGAIQSDEFPFQFSPNGRYVNMGDYRDMVWGHEVDREIAIGIDLDLPQGVIVINSYWNSESRGLPTLNQLEFHHPFVNLEILSRQEKAGYSAIAKFIKNESSYLTPEDFFVQSTLEALEHSSFILQYFDLTDTPIEFEFSDLGSLNQLDILGKYDSTTEPRKLEKAEASLRKYLSVFGKGSFELINFISSFRLHPERTYYESTKSDLKVEKFGEGYLDQIMFWDAKFPEKNADLLGWMREMELIADLKSNRLGGGRYDVQVKTKETGVFAALSDVGFGLSQFLPILVADLQLPNDSTLFIQQPESQLHPSVQANFGDYLTSQVNKTSKNYVVETHSEYLLNRIRLNIVKGTLKPEDLQVYFLESEEDDTAVHKITFAKDGQIHGAPENFFKTYFIDVMDIAIHAIPGMKNDIFIDTNIAKNFGTPLDDEYKKLIDWLKKRNDVPEKDAHLVVSKKLLIEYTGSSLGATAETNIGSLVGQMTQQGRLKNISKNEIEAFKSKYFTKKVEKRLIQLRLKKDEEHLPVFLLSYRKFGLIIDGAFRKAVEEFPGFKVRVESRPEKLPYSEDWSAK